MSRTLSARDAVARMLAGPDPSPRWWRRSLGLADEVVDTMEARRSEALRPTGLEVRAEPSPCADCGRPIQPEQAYVVNGPYHIRCGR